MSTLLSNRWFQRQALGWLRSTLPIARFGNKVIVTPYDAVTEVLERPNDFSVVPIYRDKMRRTSGDFFLGMDDTPEYHHERALTNQALRALDFEWYRKLTQQFVSEALAAPTTTGTLDVVQQLAWPVPTRLCEDFFGIRAPQRRQLFRWVRYIFQHLFLNLDDDPVVAERAEALAAEMRRQLEHLIAEGKADLADAGNDRQDFLSQLLRVQARPGTTYDDDAILRNVAGVVLGSVDTVSRAVVNALEELLGRPAELSRARAAARNGDRDTVERYVFEALRFNPHNPLVVRATVADTTLRAGSRQPVRLAAGSRVFAMTYAAMFDPRHYQKPKSFRLDRGDLSHLQFGFGFHRCFGEQLARIAIVEILLPILQLPNLCRADGPEGTVSWDGPFPDHFSVRFAPEPGLASP